MTSDDTDITIYKPGPTECLNLRLSVRTYLYDTGELRCKMIYKNGILFNGKKPSKIEYYKSGKLLSETYTWSSMIHRRNAPAYIEYYESGKIKCKRWYLNGKLHRRDKPAETCYSESGIPISRRWYEDGKLHRKFKPAEILYSKGVITKKRYLIEGNPGRVFRGKKIEIMEIDYIDGKQFRVVEYEYDLGWKEIK